MRIKLELTNTNRPTSSIRVRRSIGKKMVNIQTGIQVPVKLWNEKSRKVTTNSTLLAKHGWKVFEAESMNRRLEQFEQIFAEVLNKEKDEAFPNPPDAKKVKQRIEAAFHSGSSTHSEPEAPADLIDSFREFIQAGSSSAWQHTRFNEPLQPGTVKKYTCTIPKLEAYRKETGASMALLDINLQWYTGFVQFLSQEILMNNTISKHITCLKTVLKWKEEGGTQVCPDYRSGRFKKLKQRKVSLPTISPDELRHLMSLDLSGKLEKTRDLLVIGCWTALRVSDLMVLDKVKIQHGTYGDFIVIEPKKTPGTFVHIRLHEHVRMIYDRNNGWPPAISDQKFNQYVKELCKLAGMNEVMEGAVPKMVTIKGKEVKRKVLGYYEKWELITSHTCRRSYATNMANRMSLTLLRQITGHSTEKQLQEYIHIDPVESLQLQQAAMEQL